MNPPPGTQATPMATRDLRVGGMDCASCAATIERALRNLPGVDDVRVDVMSGKVRVAYSEERLARSDLTRAIRRIGYRVEDSDAAPESRRAVKGLGMAARADNEAVAPPSFWERRGRLALTVAAGVALVLGLLARLAGRPRPVELALLATATLLGGWYVVPRGVRAALNRALDMNFLMSAAAAGAWIIGEPEEAAATLFLFAVAELLESYSMGRARNA